MRDVDGGGVGEGRMGRKVAQQEEEGAQQEEEGAQQEEEGARYTKPHL